MHQVQTNAELAAIGATGVGFIFNDFTSGPAGAKYNLLHTAGCPWVARMLNRAEPQRRPSVRKMFFAAIDEALSWLAANRGRPGEGWKCCQTCMPDRAVAEPRPLPTAALSRNSHNANIKSASLSQAASGPMLASWPLSAAFVIPNSRPLQLTVPPRLASWNRTGDQDQDRLAEYLATADQLLSPRYSQLSGPLALRLDVGLAPDADLLHQRDLDNYLFPLATRISRNAAGNLVCVWGTKQHAAGSYLRIEPAIAASSIPPFDCCHTVRTTASGASSAFKEEISDQLSAAEPLPPGPLRLQICFTVGLTRNWLNLWKQTIDALGKILGHTPNAGPWSPLDGRIVDLGLHCRTDPMLGNDVLITIGAQHIRR